MQLAPDSGVTFHDMFCGAGGSTLGAFQAGARPVVGMNHWKTACQSYEANHAAPAACVDVVTQDPRRYPAADMLLASPECTHHSYARGKPKDDPSLFDPDGDQAAERSRATMWDVVRFAEAHAYRIVITENVGAAVKWGLPKGRKLPPGRYGPLFEAWLGAMTALDYSHQVVHLNSMVCGVPQSRDRLYVCFWKRDQRPPDLGITALGLCPSCRELVDGVQTWRRPSAANAGSYGQQYDYSCPSCAVPIQLAVRPAAAAIDWKLPATKIGERTRPLKPATMERIRRGLEKLKHRPDVLALGHGLVVQVGGNLFERPGYARAWTTAETHPTVTQTADRALVMPTTHDDSSDRTRDPRVRELPTITGANRGELALIIEHRGTPDRPGGGNQARHPDSEALGTISAQGYHHSLLIANYGKADGPQHKQGWQRHVDDDTFGTVTARDSHAIFNYRNGQGVRPMEAPLDTVTAVENRALLGDVDSIDVAECTFRMVTPEELKRASGFTSDYVLHGTRGDQVCQVGNAVTAPVERELVRRMIESIS